MGEGEGEGDEGRGEAEERQRRGEEGVKGNGEGGEVRKAERRKGRGRREYVSCYLPIVVTLCDSCVSFSGCLQKRIESLLFHPAADNVRHTHTHTYVYMHHTNWGIS